MSSNFKQSVRDFDENYITSWICSKLFLLGVGSVSVAIAICSALKIQYQFSANYKSVRVSIPQCLHYPRQLRFGYS